MNTTPASTIPDTLQPVRGDIVIAPTGSGGRDYDLGIAPGPPQLIVSGRQVATAWACEFGRRKAVDVWSTDDHASFRLLVSHRVSA